jgi:putative addiction module component (TIGR02574 family)
MSAPDLAEILKLPPEDELHLMELLWESSSAARNDVPLADAHRAAIDETLAEHQQSPDHVLTLGQVMAGVRVRR